MLETIINYLKCSGATVSVTINPWHWTLLPKYFKSEEWGQENTHVLSWLFLSIRVWIEDGSW